MKDRSVIVGSAVLLMVVLAAVLWLLWSGGTPPKAAAIAPQPAPAKPAAPVSISENVRPPRVVAPTAPPVAVSNDLVPAAPVAPAPAAPAPTAVEDPTIVAAQRRAITNNLRQLGAAAAQFMLDKGRTSASYYDLVGPTSDMYIRSINPVAGESYDSLVISQRDTYIEVVTPAGMVVRFNL